MSALTGVPQVRVELARGPDAVAARITPLYKPPATSYRFRATIFQARPARPSLSSHRLTEASAALSTAWLGCWRAAPVTQAPCTSPLSLLSILKPHASRLAPRTSSHLRPSFTQARFLPASIRAAAADPYVVLRGAAPTMQTSIKKDSTFPLWCANSCGLPL